MRFFYIATLCLITIGQLPGQDCSELSALLQSGKIEKAFKLTESLPPSSLSACNNLIGRVYLRKGRYDLAEKYFDKALKNAAPDTEEAAASLNNLGLAYNSTGNKEKARAFLERALAIRLETFGENDERTAASLNDLGLIITSVNADEALDYYEKALKVYRRLYGDQHQKVAQSLLNTALIYAEIEFFGDAVNNLNEALAIWKSLYAEGHPNEGIIYNYLAETSLTMGQQNDALAYFEKALQTYIKHYGEKHPETAYIYTKIGNYHNAAGDFKKSLDFYQKGLISNAPSFNDPDIDQNPASKNFFSANNMLSTLYFKARALMDKFYVKTRKFGDLKLSLQTLYTCDSLIDNIRQLRTSEADKLELGRSAALVYEMGVGLCIAMTEEAAKKRQYFEQALYFAEKSKSAVLLEAISDASAKSYANIPTSEIEKESQLKSDITFYERKLSEQNEDMESVQKKLFELNRTYESFVKRLETNYPDYYNLKYNVSMPTVSELQTTLDDNTLILSYYLAEETKRIYTFMISKNDFEVFNVAQDENFKRYINGLRNSIYFKEESVYELTATQLYKTLIPKKLPKGTQNVVIVPSGQLGVVPFEALLSTPPKNVDYSSYPFLINRYSISYQYALALYYQNGTTSFTPKGNSALLCAPVNFEELPDLPGTDREIKELVQVLEKKDFKPDVLVGPEASEKNVKSTTLDQYNFLHMATHGVVDESSPEESRIFLSTGGEDDGKLYSAEIYNLQLNASLVTLSACETGLGKISKGEGIIGLSRALIYAGAHNLVVSLWTVSDDSTAELMVDFYDHIDSRHFGKALKQAKMDMIKNPEYAHPFYWAPFILIGN
ncbi:CHAT domain-containing protein [Fulvivirga sp. M361]|uniref:CHAT domain-containing protein n=1 Tax=Fulvivirga sp. M361 TaxID=2594266 RepID=UPI00117A1A9D|nr:CHAT domain-containing protein [Fulvivirga sp. M361]TRX52635.1 CHAT domain-containing protein [Fulvivirga sp. M361]